MKEEIRVHLLDSDTSYNVSGKVQKVIHNGGGGGGSGGGDVEEAIVDALSPITPTLVVSAFVALLGSLSFGFVVGYASPVQSAIMKELSLSTSEYSLFGSMNNIGAAVGAILCGKLTDYLGRRRALGLADIFYILGWFSIAICQDAWLLDLGRWMLGFAISICSFVVPIYIAEFTPRNLRGGFVVLHVLMLTVGTSLVFLLGLIIPWRTLALIGMMPSLVQIISVFFIPESPRWLMMIGKNKEFVATLQRFRGATIDISHEVSDIKGSVIPVSSWWWWYVLLWLILPQMVMGCAEALEEKRKVSLLQLFQKKYAYTLTVGIGLSALNMLVGLNGILGYSRATFESAGFSGVVGIIALAVFQVPSVVLGIFLTDKCGRRPLLMISSAGLCFGCLLAGWAFALQEHQLLKGFSPYVALTGILVYVTAYPVGLGGVSAVIVSEIYPLNIKGLAGSVSALVSWLSGWLVSYAFNFAMEWSSSGTFFVFAGICVITLIFVAKLVPETKGKTLEQVHQQMNNVWQ